MSTRQKHIVFNEVSITIDVLDLDTLQNIEKGLHVCVNDILTKLNVIIKNLSVSFYNGYLIVNDRYNVYKDFEQICNEFGLEISKLTNVLKGNTYLITNDALKMLNDINSNINFSNLNMNLKINDEVIQNIDNLYKRNKYLESIISEIRENREISGKTINKIENTTYDGQIESSTILEQYKTNETMTLENELNHFKDRVNKYNATHNQRMMLGTRSIIKSRAKSMGYEIKEVKKDKQVELVLVRYL